jgi:hypothetical protein
MNNEFVSVEVNDQWRFVGGRWDVDQDGLIIPPANLADENLAFYTAHAYGDFEAEFEFRWESCVTTAAFVFRAQDACRYYVVDFPAHEQQCRDEHFWATVSKVDQRGYREGLRMQMVHGVSSAVGLWHEARIRVAGDEIGVWVDSRPVSAVQDATYPGPGRIGLATYGGHGESAKSCYRNLRIRGAALDAPPWDEGLRPARNWGVADPEYGHGCSNIVRAANGDLLVVAAGGMVCGVDLRSPRRSSDNGQTWTSDEPLPDHLRYCFVRAAPDGRLEAYGISEGPPFKIQKSESEDHGETWSAQRDVGEVKFPPEMPFAYTFAGALGVLETKDGALLIFVRARSDMGRYTYKGRSYYSAHGPSANYCLRSTDGGQTWSEPMNMDGPPHDDGFPQFCKGSSEVSAAETLDGKVLALIRHDGIRSPTMWEAWSHDGGRTWKPTSRGQFPMYASGSAMVSTTSGALIIGGRFPGISVEVSRDGGMTWNFYQVDTVSRANGAMFEIEPEVVLFIYGGQYSPERLRYQVMRLTQTGMQPVKVPRFGRKLDLDSVAALPLEITWRFKTDPRKAGTGERWFAPDVPDSDWAQIRTDRNWQIQGFENYHGSAWYRTGLTMPQGFDTRKHLWLFFEAVDMEAYVYVDGTKVFEQTFASSGLEDEIWDTPFRMDARPLLEPGREHLIAVRVDSEQDAGGIWRPVCLISTDSEAAPELVRDILQEKRLE